MIQLDGLLVGFGKWIIRSGKRVALFWSNLRKPRYRTLVVEAQLPQKLARRTLYVVEEDGFEEQAAMMCPCGCGRVLHMNLLTDERPCWRLTRHSDGTATLHPSVWRQKDCGSHFWFRKGRVIWCGAER